MIVTKFTRFFSSAILVSFSLTLIAETPKINKIEPPNWWAAMPKPMLLLRGENLSGARFTLSNPHLQIEKSRISANGHWAELWLSASPPQPETVSIQARTADGDATVPYRFNARHPAAEGFSGFSSRDAMYLIMTDRFADADLKNDGQQGDADESSADAAAERAKPRGWHGGDLRGITQHLDYIQKTGFTTVWMTPVYANLNEPDSYHGYGATDMYGVDPHYGSMDDLQALAQQLHTRHMKLVLDTVPNHVGPHHPWVDDEPDPDWLHGTKADHHEAIGDFHALVDPHAPWRDQQYVLQGWFANALPDLNQENSATSQYLIQNAIWWIEETGADGLRIDTFPYVARAFWHQFHAQIHSLYPHLTTVGEAFNCDATITSSFAGGVRPGGPSSGPNANLDTGLDTPFDFPSYCALRDVFLGNQPMSHLADTWRYDSLYPHPERLIPFLGNHDTSRFLSSTTPENTRIAFAVLLTMRGMPQIYSGDEIAMTGGDDPDNRQDFPGGWPGAPQDAFTRPTPQQSTMHDWVRQLLTLRVAQPALLKGAMQVVAANKDLLAFTRYLPPSADSSQPGKGRILVIVNRAANPANVEINLNGTSLAGASSSHTLLGDASPLWAGQKLAVTIPPAGVWIASIPD